MTPPTTATFRPVTDADLNLPRRPEPPTGGPTGTGNDAQYSPDWHYAEAERILARINELLLRDPDTLVRADLDAIERGAAVARVHAVLATAGDAWRRTPTGRRWP
jgi:hypothetical protein